MNNVSLIGRLTADPELRTTQSGLSVTRFNIAVDRQFTKEDGEKQTDFISIQAWRKTAEFICKYFSKGQKIALTGAIQTGSYTDKDGNKRYTFDVIANNVEFCEPKKENREQNQEQSQIQDKQEAPMDMYTDDDLPF